MAMTPIGHVVVNGHRVTADAARLRIDDIGLLRGYGCFEALRSYGGTPFRLGAHIDRLQVSAAALHLPLPPRRDLEEWCRDRAAEGDVIVRVVVTGGTDMDDLGTNTATLVFAHAAGLRPESVRLLEVPAPWHPAGRATELAGVKTISYAPNTAALLRARAAGYDDALLLDGDGTVLELPMASVGWVRGGIVETPALDLGILRSVTRGAMLDVAAKAGRKVDQGAYSVARLHSAHEVFVMSTTKEITPVTAVGAAAFEPGPVTAELAAGFSELVSIETAGDRSFG